MSPATTEHQINALQGMEKAGTVIITDTADFSVVTDFEASFRTTKKELSYRTNHCTLQTLRRHHKPISIVPRHTATYLRQPDKQ